jgi:hypothetical protein
VATPEVIFTDAVKRTCMGKADKKRMRADYERLYLDKGNSGWAIAGNVSFTAGITLDCARTQKAIADGVQCDFSAFV